MRRPTAITLLLMAAAAWAINGCDAIFGLKRADLIQMSAGATSGTGGTKSTSSATGASASSSSATGSSTATSSGTGGTAGTGGMTVAPVCVAHLPNVQASAVAADAATGAVYLTGQFSGTASVGGTTLTTTAMSDMFVAKLDQCSVDWAMQTGSTTATSGHSIAVASPEVVAMGTTGGVTLGGKMVPSGGFVVRYGTDGSVAWATGCDKGLGVVAVNPTNLDPIVAGTFTQLQCGATPHYANLDTDIFVTRLDAVQGTEVFTMTYDSGDFEQGHAVATDAQGTIFFGGRTEDNLNIGPTNIKNSMYAARIASNGTYLWAKSFGDGDVKGLALDGNGGLFVNTGCSAMSNDFGGGPLTALGGADLCVARLSAADGSYVWARRFGVPGSSAYPTDVQSIAVNSMGAVAVAGTVTSAIVIDGYVVTTKGFVALFDGTSGKALWVDALDFNSASVAFSPQDVLVVAGTFGPGTANFGSGPLSTGPNQTDTFALLIKP